MDTKKGMPLIGKQFKQDRQQVLNLLANLSAEEVTAMESQLKESGYDQGIKYSVEASSSINTGVEMTCSHLAD